VPGSFLLATWNIRDFDSNKFGHGKRLRESFYYIAEIISHFDLVAVQEVNRDLSALKRVMDILGGNWDYIVTDTTEGPGGNEERIAFVYDTNKIWFRNVAGEIVLPRGQEILSRKKKDDIETADRLQFARSPFVVAFQAGWFKFNLCSVHIYFGSASGAKLKRRISEIQGIAKFFAKRQKREQEDYILLGDFNIVDKDHETMQALNGEGFVVPEALQTLPGAALLSGKYYDQIAFRVRDKRVEATHAGVFDFTKSVFRDADFATYLDSMPPDKLAPHDEGPKKGQPLSDAEKREYYRKKWRTWQMSDHLPMWVQLKVDFTDDYLKSLKTGRTPLTD
jgi:endonuclease/exonuclease/phosphatase family metal-dependent hydrolase